MDDVTWCVVCAVVGLMLYAAGRSDEANAQERKRAEAVGE